MGIIRDIWDAFCGGFGDFGNYLLGNLDLLAFVLLAAIAVLAALYVVTDPEVVHLGGRFLRTVSLFYLMPAFTNGIQGFFRGIGALKVTLVSSTFNMVLRVAAAAVFVQVWKMEIAALPSS